MNPADGSILALCSQPSFDPNIFLKPILHDEWVTIQSSKQPFINRAFSAHYPPGSIFKLISMSAALETRPRTTPIQRYFVAATTPFYG